MAAKQPVQRILEAIAAKQEFGLVLLLIMTMAMMILPLPTAFADVLIAVNIGLSLMVMMVAVHISSPVEFATLPSVILITTAFRLSLSITTSRMVLVQGDAGEIIRTFGEFVIAGNVVVGLVVYLIITIVQFVVITKGSERVAEVAARFTLDALPGKQISIDTDLKNGDVDQKEARQRRRLLEKESQLYGAMDGAMKFVKGDAIASLVIIMVNLIGGMTIGCLQRGLSFEEAVRTYSLLAVGDGLIAQIPALLISLTAGVIVTRVTSEGSSSLARDISSQLTSDPRSLQIAAVVMACLAFVPGFPSSVFLTLAVLLGGAGWALMTQAGRERQKKFAAAKLEKQGAAEAAVLQLHLGAMFDDKDAIEVRLEELRDELSAELGIVVPRLRSATSTTLASDGWQLDVNGVPSGQGTGETFFDIVAQLRSTLLRLAGQFVGIQETQSLLTKMDAHYADLVREATKAAPLPRLAEVLRRLLDEQVSITNMRGVLESVAEWAGREQNTAIVAEQVRVGLRRQICYSVAGHGKVLNVMLVEGALDEAMRGLIHATPLGTNLVLDPAGCDRLLMTMKRLAGGLDEGSGRAAVLISADLRRHLRSLLNRLGNEFLVLTHNELAPDFSMKVLGTIGFSDVMVGQGRPVPHLVPKAS